MTSAASLIVFKEAIISDSADLSLFELIKWLKGKLITDQKDDPEPREVTLKLEDGSEITVKA